MSELGCRYQPARIRASDSMGLVQAARGALCRRLPYWGIYFNEMGMDSPSSPTPG